MWIVRLALRRPYTFVVMAILIAFLGAAAIVTMPVDIFPYIDIPIVSVLWQYTGLSPDEMEKRVVTNFERGLTSNVNDIEHIESQSYNGIAVVRIYFHPNVQVDMAVAQVTAQMTSAIRQMPPGMLPGNVLKYDAASVPILQLGLSSKTLREQEIFDLGNNFIRTPLGTVQGASVSYPFGGKARAVMVDLNLDELYAKQLAPVDVSNALNLQNLILPAGTAKLAGTEYQIKVNSSPISPRRTQQPAHQNRQRRHRLYEGCSPSPRRLLGAEQHRAHQRLARRTDDDYPQRQSLHAGHRQRHKSRAPENPRHHPSGAESNYARRSVGLRPRLHQRRRPRSPDRGRPHRHDDPAVPGQLAQHPNRLHLDSAFDPGLDLHPQPAGTNHQRHDPRRPRARRRHPGRRRHRRNRKHPSQHRPAQASSARRPRRRFANRRPHLRLDALDLYRIRPRAPAHRHREVFVHAPGHGRSLRHARFLPALAHPGPNHGAQAPAL